MDEKRTLEDRIKLNQEERVRRRKQLALYRWFALLRFIIIVAILFLTVKLVKTSHWYVDQNAFKTPHNQALQIIGNEITPDYKILSSMRKVELQNKPIYLVNTKPMEEEILKIDTIKRVYIRRFWFPGRFRIMVEERKPILVIAPSETVPPIAFFTEGGKLIGREYLPFKKKFDTILVLTYGIKGDDYTHWTESKVKTLERLTQEVEQISGEKVKYLDLRNPKDGYIQLETIKLRIGDTDPSVFKRIKAISAILPQIKSFKSKIKYIDLRWEETNYLKLGNNKDAEESKNPQIIDVEQ